MAVSESATGVIPVPSLQEFFRNSVDAAMTSNKVAVDSHTAHYVVSLLTFFARSEVLHDQAPRGPGLQPLALMLADAVAATSEETRNSRLQRLGDVALFVAGFMAEGLDRKAVGVGYYVQMGGGAYRTLSMARPANTRGRTFAPVFAELAAKFSDVVDVLNEVRHAGAGGRDQDVLRLYQTWLTTGSKRAERLLTQLGIQPHRQPGSVREH